MLMTATELQEHLLVASDMSEPELFNFPEGRVAAYCRRCPNKMSLNQDNAAVIRLGLDRSCSRSLTVLEVDVRVCEPRQSRCERYRILY